jgi:leucyl-tRNA synthetase
MDAHNETNLQTKSASLLGKRDLYIGGSEHATGHLLYSRFLEFTKTKGFAPTEEPFKKLINQGMILGTEVRFVYRVKGQIILFYFKKQYSGVQAVQPIHADISMVNSSARYLKDLKKLGEDYFEMEFILDENKKYIVVREVEKCRNPNTML